MGHGRWRCGRAPPGRTRSAAAGTTRGRGRGRAGVRAGREAVASPWGWSALIAVRLDADAQCAERAGLPGAGAGSGARRSGRPACRRLMRSAASPSQRHSRHGLDHAACARQRDRRLLMEDGMLGCRDRQQLAEDAAALIVIAIPCRDLRQWRGEGSGGAVMMVGVLMDHPHHRHGQPDQDGAPQRDAPRQRRLVDDGRQVTTPRGCGPARIRSPIVRPG
jgi:hypothetical protein